LKTQKIYLAVLVLVVSMLLSLPVIKVPISVSSRGIIRPEQENTKMVSLVSGKVVYNRILNNNQLVKKNDTLLVIISDELDNQKNHHNRLLSDYSSQHKDLTKLVNKQYIGLRTGQYQKELSAMVDKIAEIETQRQLSSKELERNKKLFSAGVIPQAEYDKSLFNYKQLVVQKRSVEQQQLAQWQAQKFDLQRNLNTVHTDLRGINIDIRNYVIKSPINGRLVKYSGVKQGNYLLQGQDIVEISPEDNIIAECMVLPSNIGFIKRGQKVKFKLDTYNYNQWGMAEGQVFDVDKNIVSNAQTGEYFFKVRCNINTKFLALKNGYKGDITKGQTLIARFHLTDRTLWELLFDKVDDWFNPKII
jgi:multidrug resistance efflux pump